MSTPTWSTHAFQMRYLRCCTLTGLDVHLPPIWIDCWQR